MQPLNHFPLLLTTPSTNSCARCLSRRLSHPSHHLSPPPHSIPSPTTPRKPDVPSAPLCPSPHPTLTLSSHRSGRCQLETPFSCLREIPQSSQPGKQVIGRERGKSGEEDEKRGRGQQGTRGRELDDASASLRGYCLQDDMFL